MHGGLVRSRQGVYVVSQVSCGSAESPCGRSWEPAHDERRNNVDDKGGVRVLSTGADSGRADVGDTVSSLVSVRKVDTRLSGVYGQDDQRRTEVRELRAVSDVQCGVGYCAQDRGERREKCDRDVATIGVRRGDFGWYASLSGMVTTTGIDGPWHVDLRLLGRHRCIVCGEGFKAPCGRNGLTSPKTEIPPWDCGGGFTACYGHGLQAGNGAGEGRSHEPLHVHGFPLILGQVGITSREESDVPCWIFYHGARADTRDIAMVLEGGDSLPLCEIKTDSVRCEGTEDGGDKRQPARARSLSIERKRVVLRGRHLQPPVRDAAVSGYQRSGIRRLK